MAHEKRSFQSGACLMALVMGAALIGAAAAGRVEAIEAGGPSGDLTDMSLEDLMNLEVTSVSKHRQSISEAPAAISVIGAEDIRTSGHHSIPELLRMVPGLNVARIDASRWSISSRGFNDLYANKLLVLMDGRTLYNHLFSGVYWDMQDYMLEDLERIEVIRGPGATMWGSNAVNGVINITSKSARDTQGGLVNGMLNEFESSLGVRYGGKLDEKTFYRVYGKGRHTDEFHNPLDGGGEDNWDAGQAGFRIDRYASEADHYTIQGDIGRGNLSEQQRIPTITDPFFKMVDSQALFTGGNGLARWTHVVSPESEWSVQGYYDHIHRNEFEGGITQHTLDLDFQHRFRLSERQEIIWGGGLRYIQIETRDSEVLSFDQSRREDLIASAFVQDNIELVPEKLHWFIGTKLEHNSFSEWETQPSTRILWTPHKNHSIWAAASRAVRIPSQVEQIGRIRFASGPQPPLGVPGFIDLVGSGGYAPEEMAAYEIGYRVRPARNLSLDVAAFANRYKELRTFSVGGPLFEGEPPSLVIPLIIANGLRAETYGVEIAAAWNISDEWRLTASYTFLDIEAHTPDRIVDPVNEEDYEGSSPHDQFQVHSQYRLTRDLELSASAYYVDHLPAQKTDSYIRTDVGLTWRIKPGLDVSLGVQNISDPLHAEFGNALYNRRREIPRMVYGQIVWKF